MHTRMTQQFLPEMCPRRCVVECSRPLSVALHTWKWPRFSSETNRLWHRLHPLRRWEWPVCSSMWQSGEMSQTRWYLQKKVKVLVTQSCLTLCDSVDCSPPGSSVSGILQARIREWIALHFSRGSSPPRDWTWVSCIAGRSFTIWATREARTRCTVFFHLYII